MPELLHSPVFSQYKFTQEDLQAIKHHLNDPTLQAWIRHHIAELVQEHLLTRLTSMLDKPDLEESLYIEEIFIRGVVALGVSLLDPSTIIIQEDSQNENSI